MAGEIVHIEFAAQDADRAQRFWSELFGWQFQDSGMPGIDYRMAQTNPGAGAAVYPDAEHVGHPNYYYDCADIEASLARVRELGGQTEDKAPVPGHGWFAACKDSEGNSFHLWQNDPAAGGGAPPS